MCRFNAESDKSSHENDRVLCIKLRNSSSSKSLLYLDMSNRSWKYFIQTRCASRPAGGSGFRMSFSSLASGFGSLTNL
ncbi:hypothetical protein BpHYR1_046671 [Brachionus plicatilis]|uniref:Uncharacterized protein n=1 Tax=Brachionus plicatilis TaxID=10195 RepID=A0A3M7RW06_BRAPC|nr:hypothetical protein BpHYR1_046671 [Brachionus plicatilis]